MAKDILQQAGKKNTGTIIQIPESVKKNLPRDFDYGAIGKIDLREAERIADEDIFLIKENELLAGLEDFEIIPLKEQEGTPSGKSTEARTERKTTAASATLERDTDREIDYSAESRETIQDNEDEFETVIEKEVPETKETRKSDFEYDDGRKWVSLEELEKYDEHGQKWMPLEELIVDDGKQGLKESEDRDKKTGVTERAAETKKEPSTGRHVELERKHAKPVMVDGYVERDDEYVIWDIPVESKSIEKSEASRIVGKEKKHADVGEEIADTEEKKQREPSPDRHKVAKEDEVVISVEDLDGSVKKEWKGAADLAPVEYADTLKQPDSSVDIISRPERLKEEHIRLQYKDLISSGILGESGETGKVYFIDDASNGKEPEDKSIFDESELDKIISGIVQVDEGSAYMLREANIDEDRERIAVISEDFAPVHEDLFVDLDYKYGDEELDYIHTAIVEEDYSSYIREIDEFFGIPGGRTIPAAVELLGLTADEFDTIEDMLFQDEFKDIHLYDRYHLYEFDRSAREGVARDRKNCRYLLPDENSLMDFERDSIESDVSSGSALIFEEDIHDITEQLIRRSGKTEAEIRDLVERTFGVDTPMENQPVTAQDVPGIDKGERAPAVDISAAGEGIFDITDRVVILDNEADVDRFVKEFPAGKQMNIKMLLKYLDGLFETLPEEIIKKFASSEYFELYLKVLNELGV
jgi:hypothetical protein